MPDEAKLVIRLEEAGAGGGEAGAPSKGAGKVNPQTAARDKAQQDAGGLVGTLRGQRASKGLEALGKEAQRLPGVGKIGGLASRVAGMFGGGGQAAAAGGAATGGAAAAGGAAAGGGSMAAIGGAIAATGPAAPIAAAVAVTAGAVLMAVKKGLAMAEAKTDQLAAAGVSPEIAAQRARAEAATIKSQQTQAKIIGDELARIGEARSEVGLNLQEIKSVLMEPFYEILAEIMEILEAVTEPVADFMVEHKEDIKRIIAFFIRIISPMVNVIDWLAKMANAPKEPEADDPLAEFIRFAGMQPPPNPGNVMAGAPVAAGAGGDDDAVMMKVMNQVVLGGLPAALSPFTGT